jgi:Putative auto-transporter adhesin, head GIN domain/Outer membrane protein beta-barrel domain
MKNNLFAALFILISTGYISAQVSEIRSLENFNKISISGNSKVYLTNGSPQEVRVETKNKLNEVQTSVRNNSLHIDGKPSSIYITIPEINEINISGYGEVNAKNSFSGENMEISISGNGKVVSPLQMKSINVDISGFGKVKLSGSADNFKIGVSGNGTVSATELKVLNSDIDISGVAKAYVDVSDNLNMNVSGVGSVYYKTEPKKINREVSGIGKYGLITKNEDDTVSIKAENKRIIIIGGEEKTVDTDDDEDVEIDITVEKDSPPKPPKKSRSHWAGLDIGFNGLLNDGTSSSLPKGYDFLELNSGKSVVVNLNFWKFDIPLYKRYIMLTTGIGLTLNNYRFSSDKTLISDTNRVVSGFDFKDSGEQIKYNKNKLAVNYVTAPVLIQFNTHKHLKKSFHIAAGMLFSYKFNSHLKLVYDENGDKQKTKRRDEFNIDPFRYDATVRIGYRNYTVFGTYAMSELFKNGRGPSLHPFSIGIQLTGW